MLSFLKNHPFAVEAVLKRTLVFTFAVPKSEINSFVPPCLSPDTFNNEWAFIAVAMVETEALRPKGFPVFMGRSFFLIGYRVFVRYVNNAGKNLRGLYILKSETDKPAMQLFGNLFTHYKYTTTDIRLVDQPGGLHISSAKSNFDVMIETGHAQPIPLPPGSPFQTWKEARRFAGPLPFTFTYMPATNQVLIIEGIRENWTPKPMQVAHYNFSFLNAFKLQGMQLANAFSIEGIAYHWKKGKLETWHAK